MFIQDRTRLIGLLSMFAYPGPEIRRAVILLKLLKLASGPRNERDAVRPKHRKVYRHADYVVQEVYRMTDLTTMDALYGKMGEYTRMDTELPFSEFQEFYQALTTYLQQNFQEMSEDDLVKAKGMTMILAGNAKMRAQNKDANRKKFTKMSEKAKFWEDALALRLTKHGSLTAQELEQKVSALWSEDGHASA